MAFDAPRIQENVRTIEEKLVELKIPVLGPAGDFQYDRRFFADTGYHLTHEGRALSITLKVLLGSEERAAPALSVTMPTSAAASI